jgi:hypothetical protein
MSGFENLPQAQDASVAMDQIRAEDISRADGTISDAVALKIVCQDVELAEQYLQSKRHAHSRENADNLYRGIVAGGNWPGTNVPRSSLSMPVVLEAVEKIMPVVFLALFSDKTPFLLEPRGKTTPQVARAKEKLLLWAIKVSDFKETIRLSLKDWLLYGFTVAKWGWKTSSVTKKLYKRSEDGQSIEKSSEAEEINHPTFERVELRHALLDPALREPDCRKGKFVIGQFYRTGYDLDEMRADPNYHNIPSRAELVSILAENGEAATDSLGASKIDMFRELQAQKETLKSSADPLCAPLELLEWVSEDRIITVLQRKIVIRNEPNSLNKINYLSAAFIDVPGAAYGFGIGKLLGGEQILQGGVMNNALDVLALQLNPAWTCEGGMSPGAQNLKVSPGKILNNSGKLTPLPVPSVTDEAATAIQASELRADRRVGANSADSMPTQAMRTSAGVQSFNQSVVDKLQYEIEIFSDMVFIPALEAFLEVCKDNLQPKEIQSILSEQDGKAYEGNILDVYNGTCSINVLSSTKLASRRAASQLAPLIMQLVAAAPVQDSLVAQGKKFDYGEFISEVIELTGWDVNSLIVSATPEDTQRAMMMQAGAQKAQSEQGLMAQQHQYKLEEIEASGEAKAGVQVIRHVLDESANDAALPETLKGTK